jgi:hypothetical protein
MSLFRKHLTALTVALAILLNMFPFVGVQADEGMFTPDQISKLPLRQRGLRINPLDLYNPNAPSISDAVVRLSSGCTAEFVSAKGLILTNHHCVFGALVAASGDGVDYGKDGYKADDMETEKPVPGYSVFITSRVEDVTDKVREGSQGLKGTELAAKLRANTEELTKSEQEKAPEGSVIRIQSMNSGFFHYLFETIEIKDIRMVYAPPKNIGYFGGDPDNFEWTRHSGDFAFLRAYVGTDGKAATYAKENVPYSPKKFLALSTEGLKENDFSMIFGYPGGTTRYRETQFIDYMQNVQFPFLVNYLTMFINGLVKAGENDDEKRIRLQDQIFSLGNVQKLYTGNIESMKRADILKRKVADEKKLAEWIAADPVRVEKYGDVLPELAEVSNAFYEVGMRDRIMRTLPNPGSTPLLAWLYDAVNSVKSGARLDENKTNQIRRTLATREAGVEADLARFFLRSLADLPKNEQIETVEFMFGGKKGQDRRDAENAFLGRIYGQDGPSDTEKVIAIYGMSEKELKARYPELVVFMESMIEARTGANSRMMAFNQKIEDLRLRFQQANAEMRQVRPYPDANSTLRFTFGNIKGYSRREAEFFTPFTTLKGKLAKDTGIEPFDVPAKLYDLQERRDFGEWGVGDSVPLAFLTDHDIIGGNSGSPVLNANGDQIGIAFDANYEGLGNDIFFNPALNRTISVDIRYVLFITEKFGGAGWILDELVIKKPRPLRRL